MKCCFKMEDDMNINPDKVKVLVLLYSELDDDYQKELMSKAYELSLKQSQKNLISKEGIKFKNEDEYRNEIENRSRVRARESAELVRLFEKINDDEKAQLAILLDKLSHGELTKKIDIEIKINSKKVSIKDYIEEMLPHANFEAANDKVTDFFREENRI